jgi:hypothetical protein
MTHESSIVSSTLLRPVTPGALAAFLALTAFHPTSAAEADAGSNIGLKLIAEGLSAPMALAAIPDGSGRLLVAENGGSYGWRLREGFDGFDPKNPRSAPTNAVSVGVDGKPFVDPVFTYKTLRGRGTDSNAFGVTVTGGYVYRDKAIPSLAGKYVFADWSRSMAIPDGTLLVATIPPGNSAGARWTVEPRAVKDFPNGRIKSYIWAIGEGADEELYVLANGMNSAFGTRGKVFKLVP